MTFEQAVTLLEIVVTELRENHKLLGFRDGNDGKIELHIHSRENFEALPADTKLKSECEGYKHCCKEIGEIRYIQLYEKQNTE